MKEIGKLYVVGTPIGNLGDLSPRALKTLEQADFIAAEDTRVTRGLLTHFGLRKQLISYHEHNARQRGEHIVDRLLAGESCAVVSDAGMPCISDPGEDLVRLCAERGVEVVAVPGPAALISALALSGLATGRFAFEGFLSVNKSGRRRHLAQLREDDRTLIFYEAPHKLLYTLQDMLEAWGDRRLSLARELTKLHEEVRRTTLSQAVEHYREHTPRGEFVLVVEGAQPPEESPGMGFDEAVALLLSRAGEGAALSGAAREVARESGFKKGDLYRAALDAKPREED